MKRVGRNGVTGAAIALLSRARARKMIAARTKTSARAQALAIAVPCSTNKQWVNAVIKVAPLVLLLRHNGWLAAGCWLAGYKIK